MKKNPVYASVGKCCVPTCPCSVLLKFWFYLLVICVCVCVCVCVLCLYLYKSRVDDWRCVTSPSPWASCLYFIFYKTCSIATQYTAVLEYSAVPGEILRYTWATKRSCYGVERMIDAELPLPTPEHLFSTPEHLVSIFYSPDPILLLSIHPRSSGGWLWTTA